MKFPFLKFPGEPSEAFPVRKFSLRPVIPVTLKNSGKHINLHGLIDSGADWCVFHSDFAKVLGIDLKTGKKQQFFGVAGVKIFAYFHTITLNIGGWDYECYCAFAEDFKVPYGLLGQEGFFDKFQVHLDQAKEEIELKPYPTAAVK